MESAGKNFNSRFELVILNKVDNEGAYALMHSKPLSVEILNQIPESLLVFYSGKRFITK